MAVFRQSIYTFNVNDEGYINNLVNKVGHLEIESIISSPDNSLFGSLQNVQIQDLPYIINNLRSLPIYRNNPQTLQLRVITRRTIASKTLIRVLPSFQTQSVEWDPRLEQAVSAIQYVNSVVDSSQDLAIYSPLGSLTREDAFKALQLAQQRNALLTAIDLPSRNCFLCLAASGSGTFTLEYGRQNNTLILADGTLSFDMDDGFRGANVPIELATAFNQWIQRGRTGPLFASSAQNISRPVHHQHSNNRPLLSNVDLIASCAFSGVLYFSAVTLPFILGGFCLSFIAATGIRYLINAIGCRKSRELLGEVGQTTQPLLLSSAERIAFNAGLEAARSYTGTFNAWKTTQTYTNCKTYFAAKHLAMDNNQLAINEIQSRRLRPTIRLNN